jgi:hypothetical protein
MGADLKDRILQTTILAVSSWIIVGLLIASNWPPFTAAGIKGLPHYIDLQFLYDYNQCLQELASNHVPSCDHFQFIYGWASIYLVEALIFLHLDSFLVATSLVFLLILVLSYLASAARRRSVLSYIYIIVLILSPGNLLLFERGNIDSIIFLLILLSAICMKKFTFISVFAALFSFVLKFYTLPIVALCLHFVRNAWARITITTFSIGICTFTIYDYWSIFKQVPYNWFLSSGSIIPFVYLDRLGVGFHVQNLAIPIKWLLGIFSSFLLFKASVILCTKLRTLIKEAPNLASQIEGSNQNQTYLFFSIIAVTTYFTGLNYDYRLIFLISSAIFLDNLQFSSNGTRNTLRTICLLSFLLGSNFLGPDFIIRVCHFLGDIALNYLMVLNLVIVINLLRHRFVISVSQK